jgi:hypothetical protein
MPDAEIGRAIFWQAPEHGRQSPRQQLETWIVSKVAGIQGNEHRAMDQRLGSDHAVQQFSARIPDRLDDLPTRIGSRRGDGLRRWCPVETPSVRAPIDPVAPLRRAPLSLMGAEGRRLEAHASSQVGARFSAMD